MIWDLPPAIIAPAPKDLLPAELAKRVQRALGASFAIMRSRSAPVSIAQTANPATAATVASVVTLSTQSIGTADGTRIVAICFTWETGTRDITGVTIDYGTGAQAMTAAAVDGTNDNDARIYYAAAPTGTTATFALTFDGAVTEVKATIYSVLNSSTATITSSADGSTDMDVTDQLDTPYVLPLNGGALAVACGSANTDNKSWANLTEDVDVDAGSFRHTTAFSTTAGSFSAVCQGGSNGEDGQVVCVVFSPA